MKKLFCLLLAMLLLAGCASGDKVTEGTQMTELGKTDGFQVGYSRIDITPDEAVPLSGWPNPERRISTSVTERIYATCTAFRDGDGNTILLYGLDLGGSRSEVIPFIRVAISKEVGIPVGQIMVSATHNHSSPHIAGTSFPAIKAYNQTLKASMIQAAKEAIVDLKPAKMYITSTYPEKLNFVRYYVLSDGSVGSGTLPAGITRVAHAFEPDNQLQMLKFTREGGKDVLMVNWQGHPHRDASEKSTNLSADLVGAMRTYVEKELDCHFLYMTGASGNVNNGSLVSGMMITKDYLEHGQALGKAAVEAAAGFQEVKTGKVQILGQNYLAQSISDPNSKVTVEMYAFSLGDVAFITAPYEMFDTSGVAIKQGSPFAMTFVATYANMGIGYFPTEFAYDVPYSYEAGITKVAKGTAEIMEKEYVTMLQELYKTK